MVAWGLPTPAAAQSVCLPAPRLLTIVPMGGQAGTQVEVTVRGEELEEADELTFSDPRITAVRKLNDAGEVVPNQYVVTIAADCPEGVHEARVMSRLGMSSSRVFVVGTQPEVVQKSPNTSLQTAMALQVDSVCNAAMTVRAIDYYTFVGKKGQRVVVQCAAKGIDSKAVAVLIVADAEGRDLLVERRGGALDFTVPEDGQYVVKVHELTYQGGSEYFYRLSLQELPAGAPIAPLPATRPVNAFSWPPTGLSEQAATREAEDENAGPQEITLPCDVAGRFYPAADVDVYEFEAKKGEVWWVEVASERLGLPTDPAILVQHVSGSGDDTKLTDVAEFSDIASPVKVSSNGYAYDGPPYNAGSADILGKLEIKQDGLHRLQITDLFGGTRNDPRNEYRLVIRKAQPDFALVAWPLHMGLRNGDRNALSKPIALRGGGTVALEVVAIRRDGFNGEIDLVMENLPRGVRAEGLKIAAGKSRGILLLTADADAPRGITNATFYGRATIGDADVTRPCSMATMAWPVRDAWREIPHPRLMADVPVSIGGAEAAPITVAASEPTYEAVVGSKLKVGLVQTRRGQFSGAAVTMKIFGNGFEQSAAVKVPLTEDTSEVVFDLAALKTPPGEYTIALYGGAVVKYRHRLHELEEAEEAKRKAEMEIKALEEQAKQLAEGEKNATAEKLAEAEQTREELAAKKQAAEAALKAATERMKKAEATAAPKDIADIIVSEPISIRIQPAEAK